jgi:hypothetical protein
MNAELKTRREEASRKTNTKLKDNIKINLKKIGY